jgi:hypothetical protein
MLVLFVVFGVLFYLLFIRPTVLANRLLNVFRNRDYQYEYTRSRSIADDQESITQDFLKVHGGEGFNPPIPTQTDWSLKEATLEPRTWDDVWRFRRRLKVEASIRTFNTELRGEQLVLTIEAVLRYTTGPTSVQLNRTLKRQVTLDYEKFE